MQHLFLPPLQEGTGDGLRVTGALETILFLRVYAVLKSIFVCSEC